MLGARNEIVLISTSRGEIQLVTLCELLTSLSLRFLEGKQGC